MNLDANSRLALGRMYIDSQIQAAERDRLARSLQDQQGEQPPQSLLQRALRRPAPAQARAQ